MCGATASEIVMWFLLVAGRSKNDALAQVPKAIPAQFIPDGGQVPQRTNNERGWGLQPYETSGRRFCSGARNAGRAAHAGRLVRAKTGNGSPSRSETIVRRHPSSS